MRAANQHLSFGLLYAMGILSPARVFGSMVFQLQPNSESDRKKKKKTLIFSAIAELHVLLASRSLSNSGILPFSPDGHQLSSCCLHAHSIF